MQLLTVQPLDVVVLTHDVPTHGLRRGDLGAVVERATFDEPILEPLVIPLTMVVIDELRKHPSKVALAERYYPIEAPVFERPHEPRAD